MVGRAVSHRAERRNEGSLLLPVFGRLAPPAPIADIASHIEAWTKTGDVVRIMETRPLSKDKRWIISEIVGAK